MAGNPTVNTFPIHHITALVKRLAILLLLFQISRIAFYLFNLAHFQDISPESFLRMMLGGLKFDLSAVLYVNALFILLSVLPFKFRDRTAYQKALKYLFFTTNGIAFALNTMDFFYFDFTLKRSTADVFMFAKEGNIGLLIRQFLVDYWYGVVFWLLLMAVMVYLYRRVKIKVAARGNNMVYYLSGVVILLLTIFLSVIGMRGGFSTSTRPISLINAGKYVESPLQMAIVLNTPFAIIRTIGKQSLPEKHYFTDEELPKIFNPVHLGKAEGDQRRPNIVIIVWESFAREYVGALNRDLDGGTYEGYTPFIDSLIAKSKTFIHAFANGRKSIEALPSVVASIPSLGQQPYVISPYSTGRVSGLARLLREEGYHTAFFHGAPNGSMGFELFMKVAGYEDYFGMEEYGNDDDFDGSWGIWDEEFLQFFADKMATFEEPFHTTVFTLSSHHPFKIPERYEGKFREGTIPFHKPMQYTDMALRKFFEKAATMSWYENTIFVITADHSNQAYHKEYLNSVGAFSIPIIIFKPYQEESAGWDSTVVQQTDIMPTLLDMINYSRPYLSFGSSALDSLGDHFAVNYTNSTYQIIQGNYYLQFRDDKTVGFYNYVEDRLLKNNLLNKMPAIQNKMERILKAYIQQYNHRLLHGDLTVK